MGRSTIRSQKGMASFEFMSIAGVIMALSFGVVEFGSLIQAQAVVTNVTREGGSLASRDLKNGSDLLDLLEASSWPLNFSCPVEDASCVPSEQVERFKIYVAKIDAGTSSNVDPQCSYQESGNLTGIGIMTPLEDANCGLTSTLWDMLKHDATIGTSLLTQLTVVKIYYRHDPLTPLAGLLQNAPFFGNANVQILNFDSSGVVPVAPALPNYDSFLVSSKSIF